MNNELLEKNILGTMIQENDLMTKSNLQPQTFIGRYHGHEADWATPKIIHLVDESALHGDHIETSITPLLVELKEHLFLDLGEEARFAPRINNLAKLLDAFRPGELTILGTRPSIQKTDVMTNLALYAGWKGYVPIVFSFEMAKKTLLDHLIATAYNFSRPKLRNPKKSEVQKMNWMDILELVNKANIHIDDRSSLTLKQIQSQARRIIRENHERTPIIFIDDYLKIIQPEGDADIALAMSKIHRGLKKMAKDLNCPIVCLSQPSRNVETCALKRPVLSDLRYAGSIELDADIVILLYRVLYYEAFASNQANVVELGVAKNRNGPRGTTYGKTGYVCTSTDIAKAA